MDEKEIQKALEEIATIESRIEADIKRYNLLSSQADTDKRLALMSAHSYKEDEDDEEDDEDEDDEDTDDEDKKPVRRTHDEYMEHRYSPPNPSIQTFGADAWFPSSVCIEY